MNRVYGARRLLRETVSGFFFLFSFTGISFEEQKLFAINILYFPIFPLAVVK